MFSVSLVFLFRIPNMQVKRLPAIHGWLWLKNGWELWRKNPLLLSSLAFGYFFALLLVNLLPPLIIVLPLLSLGVMNGCRATEQRWQVGPEALFSAFHVKPTLKPLLIIGLIYLAANLTASLLVWLADPDLSGKIKAILQGDTTLESLNIAHFRLIMLLATGLHTLIMIPYWFAPVLTGWWNVPPGKALFFSAVACLRNWRAFTVFGLALFALLIIAILLLSILIALLPPLGLMALLAFMLVLIPVLMVSCYCNICDVLGRPQPDRAIS